MIFIAMCMSNMPRLMRKIYSYTSLSPIEVLKKRCLTCCQHYGFVIPGHGCHSHHSLRSLGRLHARCLVVIKVNSRQRIIWSSKSNRSIVLLSMMWVLAPIRGSAGSTVKEVQPCFLPRMRPIQNGSMAFLMPVLTSKIASMTISFTVNKGQSIRHR